MNVKISVIMSVYNGGEFLKEAIESILNQSYKNIEFVIINDGSSDDSLVIIQKYMAMDSRILLINQKNMGLTKSLNIGVMRATGKYIARQDADDISMPDRFKLFFEFLEKDGDIDMYSTPAILFNKDHPITKVIPNYFRRNGFNQSMLNYHNSLIHGTLIIKSSLIKKFKYNEFFKYSQDFELYHRLMNHSYSISYDQNNITYKLRIHLNSISNTHSLEQFKMYKKVFYKNNKRFYKTTLLNKFYFRMIDVFSYFFHKKTL